MPLKDLLVLLDGSKRSEMRLELTADLARRHGANLTGLHVPDIFAPGADPGQVLSSLELPRMREGYFLEAGQPRRTRGRMARGFRRSGTGGLASARLSVPGVLASRPVAT